MNSARIAARLPVVRRPILIHRYQISRAFSCTSLRRASEDSDSFLSAFKNSPLFNQLAEKPEALAALNKVAEYVKKKNIDLSEAPSSMTLFRLATDSEFRELARTAMEEIRQSGIDLRPENAMELFSQSKDPKDPK